MGGLWERRWCPSSSRSHQTRTFTQRIQSEEGWLWARQEALNPWQGKDSNATVALETDINKPLYANFKIEKLQNCAMYCVEGLLIINSFYDVMVRITLCSAHNRQHNMKVLLKSTLTRLLLTPDWRACKSIL